MKSGLALTLSAMMLFSLVSAAYAATDEEVAAFVEQEAYTIADKLKLRDLVKSQTKVEITAHRMDPSGIHWIAGDVRVHSKKYGACAVAVQLKFVEDEQQIMVVGSKGVLAALELNKGVVQM